MAKPAYILLIQGSFRFHRFTNACRPAALFPYSNLCRTMPSALQLIMMSFGRNMPAVSAMSYGERAVDHGSIATGVRSYRVHPLHTAPLIIYPSVRALNLAQALKEDLVSSPTLFGRQLKLGCFEHLVTLN